MKLLHIDSSALGDASVTRQLTASLVRAWSKTVPEIQIIRRDLVENAPDHLSGELLQVIKFQNFENLNPRQQAEHALVEELVDEFLAADIVVIGAPMYNFSVPTQLKAWLDRIAQAGRTFRYTAQGPIGLAGGRKVIIASARGGRYAGTPMETALDHQESYLRAVLGFLGVTDVTVVRVEGASLGPDVRAQALEAAQQQIDQLVLSAV